MFVYASWRWTGETQAARINSCDKAFRERALIASVESPSIVRDVKFDLEIGRVRANGGGYVLGRHS